MKSCMRLLMLLWGIFMFNSPISILAQCPATYTSEGVAAYDSYGNDVAVIGDFNNDGYNDYAVADAENDESHTRAGKVDIFSGYDGSLMFTILGEVAFDRLGTSISGGEDINDDGYADLVIGALWYGSNQEGRAYIFYGETSPSNADASEADVIISGTNIDAEFGGKVCLTNEHVLISSLEYDNETGRVYIFRHVDLPTSGLITDNSAYASYIGEAEGDYFGVGLAGIERGPGQPDCIFIGAMWNDDGGPDAGKVYEINSLFLDPGAHSAGSISITFTGTAGRFGQSIAGGYLNDDDIEDIIIGAPYYSKAYVFYNVPVTDNQAADADLIISGPSWFGLSVASPGDFNFDGVGDIVVGAQGYNGYAGKAFVFSGDDGTELFSAEGIDDDDFFGTSVAGGDISGDGLGDIIIGSVNFDGTAGAECGKSYVYQGICENRFCNIVGQSSFSRLGNAVSGAGDVNNDGFPDFIVGAEFVRSAYVFSGMDGGILWTFTGDSFGNLGASVSGGGDVNNDGYDDLLIGDPGNILSGGVAQVYSGFDGSLLYEYTGIGATSTEGKALDFVGDLNNDGYDEFVISNHTYNNSSGRVRLFSGVDGSLIKTHLGVSGEFLGASVSGGGDINNDGYNDIIIGAPNYNDFGHVYVISGQNNYVLHTFVGESSDDEFGSACSMAGDVNNDGYDDLIIGAPYHETDEIATGRIYVYSGADWSLLYSFDGEYYAERLGSSVCSAGDIDDDCYADFMAGTLSKGYVNIYSGVDGSLLYHMKGGLYYGYSISDIGDVNNDGRSAIIVGEHWNNTGGEDAGRVFVYVLGTEEVCLNYICGDANDDNKVNVSDAVSIINYVFSGGETPNPIESCDGNCDDKCNVSDAVYIINFVFSGGYYPCDTNGDEIPDC